ncbi:hypothetical protein BV898_04112 [Hypsibius exemplaris]|uniref:Uncharacterized protein n=1 Tax=Hypsibius exemplaris TaxID=2072580 RepID=A0A1W0X333_HYPEX|nr:hypothetical protein BV898_04112 [Hypsibius exemplaris]
MAKLDSTASSWVFSYEDAKDANETVYDFSVKLTPVTETLLWTQEFVAAATGFEAFKYYENHLLNEAKELQLHTCREMSDLLQMFSTAEVNKIIELRKLNHLDAAKVEKMAAEQALGLAKERYGEGETGLSLLQEPVPLPTKET